jgi:hypothetical protein
MKVQIEKTDGTKISVEGSEHECIEAIKAANAHAPITITNPVPWVPTTVPAMTPTSPTFEPVWIAPDPYRWPFGGTTCHNEAD